MSRKPSVLIICTGGTIGMVKDTETGTLETCGILSAFRPIFLK
ncbi:MAG: hypothetical protein R2850_03840 [Bacteroidia bacterium]